ncbi:hypothetical protein E4U16_002291 [Claviceps sp. LM84 group G4]|nr:hypothetical protein E4U16_002291 [Claviceps sp. LM84 group G4]
MSAARSSRPDQTLGRSVVCRHKLQDPSGLTVSVGRHRGTQEEQKHPIAMQDEDREEYKAAKSQKPDTFQLPYMLQA